MKKYNRGKCLLAVIAATFLAGMIFMPGDGGLKASTPVLSADAQARAVKARRLAEMAGNLYGDNILLSSMMYTRAGDLAPQDTAVRLALNNAILYVRPRQNELYFPQLEMLEAYKDAPMFYYLCLLRATPPDSEMTDSMTFHNTALKAYHRFPDNELFIDNLLNGGVSYLYTKRFVDNGGKVDTLDLSPSSRDFAQKLLNIADTIESRTGFSTTVDRARVVLFNMLDRNDDIDRLVKKLEERDSTDIGYLDLLTNIAYMRNDSTRLAELGLIRLDLAPEPEYVYSLYDAMPNNEMREQVRQKTIGMALDTDLDPELRMNMMRALVQAYYDAEPDSVFEKTEFLDHVSNALDEMIAEDPGTEETYIKSIILAKDPMWIGNYGYKFWMKAVDEVNDSVGELLAVASFIVPVVPEDAAFESKMQKLKGLYGVERPDLGLTSDLVMAQYYYNTKQYAKALAILEPVTIEALRESTRLSKEYASKHPDNNESIKEDTEAEDSELQRFVQIKSLMSDCQINLNRIDDALATLHQIIAVDPQNHMALNNLAYYMCINNKDLTLALSLAERALAIDPTNINAIDTRAWILFKKGDVGKARKDMVSFFDEVKIGLYDELLDVNNAKPLDEMLGSSITPEALEPVLGHLLAILAADGTTDKAVLERIVALLKDINPDNEDLKEYLLTAE